MAANDRVGNVYLDVLPRGTGFNSGVQAIIDKAERDAQFALKANTGQAQQQVQQLGQQITDQIGGGWQQAALRAAEFTGAVFGIKMAVQGVVGQFATLFDGIAKARAGFNAILGEKAGGNLLAEVRQFAIDSPFVTSELVQYSQMLLGVGKAANTIVPTLKSVGDIVASVGGDTQNMGSVLYALTQVQSIGHLTGMDARKLQMQLVPITRIISEYTHQSVEDVKKMQEAGGVAADVVFKAIDFQGQKVKGALNNSIRTISGAMSVLTDNLRNFVQSNPQMQAIFQDIVKAIQDFANYITKPEIIGKIQSFITAIGNVYEQVKPVVEGLVKSLGGGVLTAMSVFSQTMGAVASVLKAVGSIPGVLPALGAFLGAIVLLKAPVTLITYVNNIHQAISGIAGLGQAQAAQASVAASSVTATEAATVAAAAATDAYVQETLALEGLAVATAEVSAVQEKSLFQKFKGSSAFKAGTGANLGLSAGLLLGGQGLMHMTSETNSASQTAGGALTGAGIGMMIGPEGAAAGALLGGLYGYFAAQDAKMKEQIKKSADLGKKAAEAYMKANNEMFASGSTAGIEKLKNDLDNTNKALADAQQLYFMQTKGLTKGADAWLNGDDKRRAAASGQLAMTQGVMNPLQKAQQDQFDKQWQPVIDAVTEAEKQGHGAAFFDIVGRAKVPAIKSIEEVTAALATYGVTATDVVSMGKVAFTELATTIDGLDSAQKKATISANAMVKALTDAKGISDAIYGGPIKELDAKIGAKTAMEAATKAARDAVADPTKQDEAQKAIDEAKQKATELAIAQSNVYYDNQIKARKMAGKDETMAADLARLEVLKAQSAVSAVNLTADRVQFQVEQQIAAQRLVNHVQEEVHSDLLNANLDQTVGKYIKLAGLVDTVSNRKIVIDIETKNMEKVQAALLLVESEIENINNGLGQLGREGTTAEKAAITDMLKQKQKDLLAQASAIGSGTDAGTISDITAAGKGDNTGQKWADKVKAATEAMASKLQSAADSVAAAAEKWTTSIKERTQYEQAVSTGRLIKNATSQSKDLTEMTSGLANLRSRGVSDAVLKSLGIDTITDTRQVRKLVNSSDADLAKLTSAVSNRDKLATDLATTEQQAQQRKTITQAIIDAAKALDITIGKDKAAGIASQFNITSVMDSDAIAKQILSILSGGRIG